MGKTTSAEPLLINLQYYKIILGTVPAKWTI